MEDGNDGLKGTNAELMNSSQHSDEMRLCSITNYYQGQTPKTLENQTTDVQKIVIEHPGAKCTPEQLLSVNVLEKRVNGESLDNSKDDQEEASTASKENMSLLATNTKSAKKSERKKMKDKSLGSQQTPKRARRRSSPSYYAPLTCSVTRLEEKVPQKTPEREVAEEQKVNSEADKNRSNRMLKCTPNDSNMPPFTVREQGLPRKSQGPHIEKELIIGIQKRQSGRKRKSSPDKMLFSSVGIKGEFLPTKDPREIMPTVEQRKCHTPQQQRRKIGETSPTPCCDDVIQLCSISHTNEQYDISPKSPESLTIVARNPNPNFEQCSRERESSRKLSSSSFSLPFTRKNFLLAFLSVVVILACTFSLIAGAITAFGGKFLFWQYVSNSPILWVIRFYVATFHIKFIFEELGGENFTLLPKGNLDNLTHRGFLQSFIGILDCCLNSKDTLSNNIGDILNGNLTPRGILARISISVAGVSSKTLFSCGVLRFFIGLIVGTVKIPQKKSSTNDSKKVGLSKKR